MPSSDDVVIKDRNGRNRLLEYIVDKRTRSLDYLRVLHTTGDALWMNSVRLTREDLAQYFHCQEGGVGSCVEVTLQTTHAPPAVSLVASSSSTPPPVSPPSPALSHSTPGKAQVRKVAQRRQGVTAPAEWVQQHCKQWFVIGYSLGALVQLPISGLEFLDCVMEMLLEFDVYFASNAARRALAQRALKKDREDRGLKHNEELQSISNLGGYIFLQMPPNSDSLEPSYEVLVPPLCSALQFAYRKLCDYEICHSDATFKKLLNVDRQLKHVFFGAISKQLAKLAETKLQQQQEWITESLFAAFSHAESGTLQEWLQPPPSTLMAGGGIGPGTTGTQNRPTSSSGGAAGGVQDRDSVEYYFDDDEDDYDETH